MALRSKLHHIANGFRNPWPTWSEPNSRAMWKWVSSRKPQDLPYEGELQKIIPGARVRPPLHSSDSRMLVVKPDWNLIHNPPKDKLQVTWLGHATVLVQLDGFNAITDPVFSERCSPLTFAGMFLCFLYAYDSIYFIMFQRRSTGHGCCRSRILA